MKIWLDERERKDALFSRFVDSFLADSRGDEIKVYCVLLHLAGEQDAVGEITPQELAERLDITEKSVQRCLKTWEKRGLLRRSQTDASGESEVILTGGSAAAAEAIPDGEAPAGLSEAEKMTEVASEEVRTAGSMSGVKADLLPKGNTLSETLPTFVVGQETRKRTKDDEEFSDLVHEFSVFMSQPLTSLQLEHLTYLYGELDMGYELLHYLLELCVARSERSGKQKLESFRYFESIALSWHKRGIRDVVTARTEGQLFPKEYFEILRECGISTSGRTIRPYEEAFFTRWLYEYGYAMPMIKEAIRRSFKTKGDQSVSFEYIDGILSGWFKKGVRTLEDANREDETHRQSQQLKAKSASGSAAKSRQVNAFTDYDQRVYDYDALMQKLREAGRA